MPAVRGWKFIEEIGHIGHEKGRYCKIDLGARQVLGRHGAQPSDTVASFIRN